MQMLNIVSIAVKHLKKTLHNIRHYKKVLLKINSDNYWQICLKIRKSVYICTLKRGPVAQLNRAFDYGSEGYRFESCRGHQGQY